MKISYFVFTSGEEGENLLDWGVKHSSEFLGNRKILDTEYQSLLADFRMTPSLDIPEDGKVNLLLLPHKNKNVLLGYIFASHDHKGRANTSAVVCVLPPELLEKRAREIARKIWNSNNLKGIALHEVMRTDMLELDGKAKTEGSYPFVVREWPSKDTGYFSAGNNIRELGRVFKEKVVPDKPDNDNDNSNLRKIILCACAGIALCGAVAAGISRYTEIQNQKNEAARLERERLEQERIAKLEAEAEAEKRREAERQRVKSIADNIISDLKAITELEGLSFVSADNFLPPLGDETDSPFGKLRVCKIDDDYAFLDAEALKNILMSFCGEEYRFNIQDKCFAFSFSGNKALFDSKLRSSASEIFISIHSIKPSQIISSISPEEYIMQTLSKSVSQNFRLFYKCEGDEYIIVFVNAARNPQIYIGTKSDSVPVNAKNFLHELIDAIEVNDNQKTITFYLKHSDSRLTALDTGGKFDMFIEQLAGGKDK